MITGSASAGAVATGVAGAGMAGFSCASARGAASARVIRMIDFFTIAPLGKMTGARTGGARLQLPEDRSHPRYALAEALHRRGVADPHEVVVAEGAAGDDGHTSLLEQEGGERVGV